MKIIVVGKYNKHGKSKAGKDYDGNIVYYTSAEDGVEGVSVGDAWLDPQRYPLADIIVGKPYTLDYDSKGFVKAFAPI